MGGQVLRLDWVSLDAFKNQVLDFPAVMQTKTNAAAMLTVHYQRKAWEYFCPSVVHAHLMLYFLCWRKWGWTTHQAFKIRAIKLHSECWRGNVFKNWWTVDRGWEKLWIQSVIRRGREKGGTRQCQSSFFCPSCCTHPFIFPFLTVYFTNLFSHLKLANFLSHILTTLASFSFVRFASPVIFFPYSLEAGGS